MSNKTELQANNIELQEILDSVNALPDAGSGGGLQFSVGTAKQDPLAIYVDDLPFAPKYVAIFACESRAEDTLGLVICSEFGILNGVEYSSQTEPLKAGTGGSSSKTYPSEIQLTDNGFICIPEAAKAPAYRYVAVG